METFVCSFGFQLHFFKYCLFTFYQTKNPSPIISNPGWISNNEADVHIDTSGNLICLFCNCSKFIEFGFDTYLEYYHCNATLTPYSIGMVYIYVVNDIANYLKDQRSTNQNLFLNSTCLLNERKLTLRMQIFIQCHLISLQRNNFVNLLFHKSFSLKIFSASINCSHYFTLHVPTKVVTINHTKEDWFTFYKTLRNLLTAIYHPLWFSDIRRYFVSQTDPEITNPTASAS